MCHVRSGGTVANFKNEVCENGGSGFACRLCSTCCTCSLKVIKGSGGWGGNNVLDEYFTWPTELVAVVNMLHILSYGHQGGSEGGDNVLEEYNTWPRELVSVVRTKRYTLGLTAGHGVIMSHSPCWSLLPWRCRKHFGSEASGREKTWMGGCLHGIIENHKFLMTSFFNPRRTKSIHRAGETDILTLESHACQST